MCRTLIYKLEPKTSFHVGERGVGIERTSEIIHSDTLFSAIVSAWRFLGEEMGENGCMSLLKPFTSESGSPPFKLSSAFPYAKDVILFPAPLTKPGGDKKAKKAEFLSQEVLLSGDINGSAEMQGGKVRLTQAEKDHILSDRDGPSDEHIWKTGDQAIVPRVTVDRVSSASEIYHCGELLFSRCCGLYFWVELRNESYESHLDRAIDFLSEEGIGGERSSGCGQFSYRKECNVKLPTVDGAKNYMTLSLYHPTCAEVKDGVLDDAAYDLVNCRGWVYSPDGSSNRRRTIRMITEGSIFSRPLPGDIVDIRPCGWKYHPVYRSGLAFTLPLPARWGVTNDD